MKLALILLPISNFAFAQVVPNYTKEKRWAAQVEGALLIDDTTCANAKLLIGNKINASFI
jgi:hypothetical protein